MPELSVISEPKKHRERLLGGLGDVLSISLEKFKKETASNADRQAWGRLLVQASVASGNLLNADLEERVEVLEKAILRGESNEPESQEES